MSTRSRSSALDVLALIASDFAYRPGTAPRGTSLQSFPDSNSGEEFGFSSWLFRDLNTSPLTGAVLDGSRADRISVVRTTEWEYVTTIEDSGDGFGAVFFRSKTVGSSGKYEYILAMRGTDGQDRQDWFANLDLGMRVWNEHRDEILRLLTTEDDRELIPSNGIVHFTGQSLGGGLAQYAAYDYARLLTLDLGVSKAQLASRLTLTTFNGFGGVRGLAEFHGRDFNPYLIEHVSTAHYVIDNDLVHRLGAGKPADLFGVGGSWHLNGANNTFQLNFVQHDASGIRRPGPQNKLGIIEGHRIESGFYQGFELHRTNFRFAAPASIDYIDTDQSQSIGAALSRVFNRGFTTSMSATARLAAGLLAIGVVGSRQEIVRLTQEVTTALYRSGMNKTFKYFLDVAAPGFLLLAANSNPGAVSYVASIGLATLLEALPDSKPEDKEAVRLTANGFLPAERPLLDEPIQPTPGALTLPMSMLRFWQLISVYLSSLPGEEVSALVTDTRMLAFIDSARQAGVDPEQFADLVTRRSDWLAYSEDFLGQQWLATHSAEPERAANYTAFTIDLAASLDGLAEAIGAGDSVFLAQVRTVLKDLLADLGKALAQLPVSVISSATASTLDLGTNTLGFDQFQKVIDVVEDATQESETGSVRAFLDDTLASVRRAGQAIIVQPGSRLNPFEANGVDPESLPASSAGIAEGHARLFTLYLPYEADEGGQRVKLQLQGAAAPMFKAAVGGQVIDLQGGEFNLLVAEGQRQVSFGLWSRDDVDAPATLSLKAQLVDASGSATHVEHLGLELDLAAVDEQLFAIPGLVVTDTYPQNPEIHGSDFDEQILGKSTADVVYPYEGADFVLTGDGDDSVLVHALTGDDTAGDWIDLGDGNDFAVRWAGDDTLIGGLGSDVMLAGADADRLYSEMELVLADAIALGESQGAGGAGDLLDGWSGNDIAIGWNGADGILGGDGEDVLVGMGGDDNIFGDWQFSQYIAASADWRVERETTWINPDRRKVTARLVSVLMTEASAAGGADTIFGGAGADWLLGQAGDDFLDGGRDDDVLFGDEGADALYGRDGADILSGDELDDGTAEGLAGALHGADTLDGGAGDDELAGNGGDDQLYGGDGNDSLGGDDPVTPGGFHGKDYLDGGPGRDKLWGEGSDDWLIGGDGDDHLEGDYTDLEGRSHGADHLDGGAGDDELIGQGGSDELYGGEGNDTIAGDNGDNETLAAEYHGDDLLDGGAGNDSLKGGGGKDRLFGGDGQDSLVGDGGEVEGDDELHGGADGDTLAGDGGEDRLYGDGGEDFLDGGAGDDLLQGGADRDRLEGGEGDDVYVLRAGDSPSGAQIESIADSGGRDTVRLVGTDVRSVRRNGDMPDVVIAFGGDDEVLIEGGFTGSIESFDLGDGLVLGWQQLLGRYLDDPQNALAVDPGAMLAGSARNDTLTATGGGATLAGGRGDDSLIGSGGGNSYLYSLGDGTDTVQDTGGQAATPNRLVFGAGITPDTLRLSTGSLVINVGWDPRDRIVLPAFDPNDVLAQRAIDLVEFHDGTTLTYDQLIARGFDIDGTDAAEALTGTNTVDRMYGAAGDDVLNAGLGADLLDGGPGNDTLTGGAGDDVYLFGYGDGQDTIADGATGDIDALAFFAGVGGADVELERLANDLVVKLRNALDQVTVRDQFAGDGIDRIDFADGSFWDRIEIAARLPNRLTEGPDNFTGSAYADTIYGRGGGDRLDGQAGDDLVDGGDGADWLFGGNGADALEGGAGADTLQGEDGADTLSGGPGDDTLRGGTGSDMYRFAPGDGRDTIDDYDASANRVDVLAFWASDSTQVALRREWSIYDASDDLYFDLLDPAGQPTGEWVRLWRPFFADDPYRMVDRVEFADATVWTAADIRSRLTTATGGADRFRGFGGADALDGGAGDDTIAGGEGNDVILGGDGADSLWGENGDDILEGGAGDDALSGDFTYPGTWLYQGRDVLRGGAGADSLDGGGGADMLEGGPGADRLLGGEHDDLYLYARGDGADEIDDRPFYSNGTGGNDTLRFAAGIVPADVELYRTRASGWFAPGDDLVLVIDASSSQIRIASYFAPTREIETIEFHDGTRWTRTDVEARLRTGAADTLTGTAGDDTFAVDNDRDVVVEQAGGGTDAIESIVSYQLPANVEHLTLTGALNASLTGNDLDNVLRGNASDNRLTGGRGSDTLIGGRGDDTYVDEDPYIDGYYLTYTPDSIVEAAGEGYDTVEAKAYDYALPENVERLVLLLTPAYSFYDSQLRTYVPAPRHATGNALDNVLDASRALSGYPVILDGAAGADAYIGHRGPDTYRLADPGDRILATGDAVPVDAVESAFDFDLAGIGLTLTLIGDAPISGWGNDSANALDGSRNAATNVLAGRRGDDRYVLGAGDAVIEQAGEGRDAVRIENGPLGEYRLEDYPNVEALELGELLYSSSLIGGAGDDALTGNRFANRLEGGAGSDTLAGGDGSDTYFTGRIQGRRADVARIDEDRVTDDDTQYLYSGSTDTIVLGGLQDDLQPLVRVGNDLVLEQVRRASADPADDLLFESVRVVNYFAGARYQVERVRFGDGAELDLARLVAAGVRVPGAASASTSLHGQDGPDGLIATDAASSLYGGYGDDMLRGGAAGDVLAGEGGNDRMIGGAGDDRYTFAPGFGRDYVDDAGGDDTLEFSGLSSTGVIVRASGDRLELAFASGDTVVVRQDLGLGVGIERAYFAGDNAWLDAAALVARAVGPVGNLAPLVNAPPRDRAVLEDEPVALALGADAFVDLDPGDTLAFSLAGTYGASLPAWLAFDAQTLTISGTPGNADVGPLPLELVATDGAGARASWTINLVVNNVNDAPMATPPAAQTAFAGQVYVLAVLPDVFSDADPGDWLRLDATLAGGDPLPDWLWFDDGALLGEPTAADLGRYVIELLAFDLAGATASAAFTLDVLRENHAPTLAAAIPNQAANEDAAWAYVVPSATFGDVDADDALAYSATLATGAVLPAWLAFDPATRGFSGTPQNDDVGTVSIRVTATDVAGATASDTFDLKVNNVNDAPLLLRSSDAASVEEGQPLSYLANAAFVEIDAGDALTYSARLANGSALPSWLSVNATTGKLSGTPAIGAIGTFDVQVTAKDKAGATATLPLQVTVLAAPPQNLVGTSSNNTLTGKSGDDRLDGKGGADTMRGGLGNDTYVVDNTGDSVAENANAGSDLVESSITYSVSSRPYVEHIVLTGTAAINATGNGANNLLRGNAANNTLTGSGGVDVLQGLGGNDRLSDSGGNGLLHGGAGTDTMTGNSGRQLFVGGPGNDTISPSTGADFVAFNKGDGQDTVNGSTGTDNVLSLGGGITYSELFLSKSGNNLVLEMGPTDRVTFKDWYESTLNRSVATLQVIAEAMAGYDPAAADPLLDRKVATFDFTSLVQAFDAARVANANMTRWQMMDALLTAHLAASDTEALGGDLAYQYGLTGSLAGIGFDVATAIVSSAQFATAPQALQPAASLQQGVHRLA